MSHIGTYDVVVIGGGQAGLAIGYYLRRTNRSFVLLDAESGPGGAWRHAWDSLHLFSPAQWSSLPGWFMPRGASDIPTRDEVIDYLARYEARYQLPIERPVQVQGVRRIGARLRVATSRGEHAARAVVSATGSWTKPFIPSYPGREVFRGAQLHSAYYRSPESFRDQTVLIVGGGNSGAQILAEVSRVAETLWVTLDPPRFLPDDVDGRVLFDRATERYKAQQEGRPVEEQPGGLGSVVMVPSVKDARARGVLESFRPFTRFTERGVVWPEGNETYIDAVIWCTGFAPALDHLAPLGVLEADGRVLVDGTRSVRDPQLWLVGYGDWTGFASATLVGVGRTARETVREIEAAEVPGGIHLSEQ